MTMGYEPFELLYCDFIIHFYSKVSNTIIMVKWERAVMSIIYIQEIFKLVELKLGLYYFFIFTVTDYLHRTQPNQEIQ